MEFEKHFAQLLDAASVDLDPPVARLRSASVAGGRRRLRRRRVVGAGLGVVLVGAAVAGTTVFVGPSPNPTAVNSPRSGGPQVTGSSSGASSPSPAQTVDVDLAAYSVHADAHGTLTVTLRIGVGNFGLSQVRQILAGAGVRADFDGIGLPGTRPWCTAGALPPWIKAIHNNGADSEIALDPGAIPAGTIVRFIVFSIPDSTAAPNTTTGFGSGTLFVGARTGETNNCVAPTLSMR